MSAAKDLRNDPDYLRSLLGEARAEILHLQAALVGLAVITRVIAARPYRRPSVADVEAERRVLGAMISGRASSKAVASLHPKDFTGPGHELMFAVVAAVLEVIRVKPGPYHRRRVAALAGAVLARSKLEGWQQAVEEMQWLPRPGRCPSEEIALVAALGRWRRG